MISNYNIKELEDDCNLSTENHFNYVVRMIDKKFGDGYAKEHPELIGALVQSASMEFRSITLRHNLKSLDSNIDEIREHIGEISVDYKIANCIVARPKKSKN